MTLVFFGWTVIGTASLLWVFLLVLQVASKSTLPRSLWNFARLIIAIGYFTAGSELIPYYLWGWYLPREWQLAKNLGAVLAFGVLLVIFRFSWWPREMRTLNEERGMKKSDHQRS